MMAPFIPFLNFCVYRVKKGIIIDRKPDFKLWDWSTRRYFRRKAKIREVKVEAALLCDFIKLSGLAYLDASRIENEDVEDILNKIDWPDWQNVLLLGFEPSDVIDLLKENRLVTAVFYEETDNMRVLQDYADLYLFSGERAHGKYDKRLRREVPYYKALRRVAKGLLRKVPTLGIRCFFYQRPDVSFESPWYSYEDYVAGRHRECSTLIEKRYGGKRYKALKPILPRLPPAIYVPYHIGEIEYHKRAEVVREGRARRGRGEVIRKIIHKITHGPWSKGPVKTELEEVEVPVSEAKLVLCERVPFLIMIHFGGEAEKYARVMEVASALRVKRIDTLWRVLREREGLSLGEADDIILKLRDKGYLKVEEVQMEDGASYLAYKVLAQW